MEYGIKIFFDRGSIREMTQKLRQAMKVETGGAGGGLTKGFKELGGALKNLAGKAIDGLKASIKATILLAGIMAAFDTLMDLLSSISKMISALVRPFINFFMPVFLAIATLLMPFLKLMNLLFKPLYITLMRRYRESAEKFKSGEITGYDFFAAVLQDTITTFAEYVALVFGELAILFQTSLVDQIKLGLEVITSLMFGSIEMIVSALGVIATLIASAFGKDAQEKVNQFFQGLLTGVQTARDDSLHLIAEKTQELKDKMAEPWENLKQKFFELKPKFDEILEAEGEQKQKLEGISPLVVRLNNLFDEASQKNLTLAMRLNIVKIMLGVAGTAAMLFGNVIAALGRVISRAAEQVSSAVQKIKKALEDSKKTLGTGLRIGGAALGAAAGGIPGAVLGYLGGEALARAIGVGDFILTPRGELIKTSPDDYLIGTKKGFGTANITINVSVRDGRDFVENIDRYVDEAVERIMNRRLGAYGVYR